MQADLVPTGKHAASHGNSPVGQFFVNFQLLADKNKEQAAILFGMLFTLVIWIFSALSLLMAAIFYITFLWHHIRDGSLSRYCRRKIDTRLHKIVMIRVNRALDKDSRVRAKQEAKGARMGPQGDFKRQPTVPTVPVLDNESPQEVKPLALQMDPMNTPSDPYPLSKENIQREPTVPDVLATSRRPQLPSRSTTQSSAQSNMSYADNTPLIGSAAPTGYGPPGSYRAPPTSSHGHRSNSYDPSHRPIGGPSQSIQKPVEFRPQGEILLSQHMDSDEAIPLRYAPSQPIQNRKPIPQPTPSHLIGRSAGPPGNNQGYRQEYEMQSRPPGARMTGPSPRNGGYVAFNPPNQGHGAVPQNGHPPKHFTRGPHLVGSHPEPPRRSGTAPIPTASYNDELYDAYGGSWQEPQTTTLPPRPATAGPGGWNRPGRPMPPRY